MFPKLSDEKIKGGIFVGPQVKKIMKDKELMRKLRPGERERQAWKSFIDVVEGFLGNNKVENYTEVVQHLITAYKKMGCRMPIKLHVLHSHMNVFKSNMGIYSELTRRELLLFHLNDTFQSYMKVLNI